MANFVVTITGADDEINPADLVSLSKLYPFVEWGILFSKSTSYGTKRYPTRNWRSALYAEAMGGETMPNLSAHLCGEFAEDRLKYFEHVSTEVETFYRRIQFNRFNKDNRSAVEDYAAHCGAQVIIPINKKTSSVVDTIGVIVKPFISVLFDTSGGRGVDDGILPEDLPEFNMCGFAGGITEENIEDKLKQLSLRYGEAPFWIDLETGARDLENNFSLSQVERILRKASPFHSAMNNEILLAPKKEESRIILLNP